MEEPTPARLEAFSDGVIAVIVTIMVLELKVPHDGGLAGLRAIVPTLLVYLLSFFLTAIYWVNHHRLVDRVERVDERILYANLVFLFCLSLVPFLTNYLLEKRLDAFSVTLYTASMLLTGLGFLLLRMAILRALRRTGRLTPPDRAALRKHLGSFALYLVAFPVAQANPMLALGLIGAVTLAWVVPGIGVEPCPEPADRAALPSDTGMR